MIVTAVENYMQMNMEPAHVKIVTVNKVMRKIGLMKIMAAL
jgi:hypothetical protein